MEMTNKGQQLSTYKLINMYKVAMNIMNSPLLRLCGEVKKFDVIILLFFQKVYSCANVVSSKIYILQCT
jgi:hypothetical protein